MAGAAREVDGVKFVVLWVGLGLIGALGFVVAYLGADEPYEQGALQFAGWYAFVAWLFSPVVLALIALATRGRGKPAQQVDSAIVQGITGTRPAASVRTPEQIGPATEADQPP
jgi:hypothetical protein